MKGRMCHPEHGFHVPMPGEADVMLKNGWLWEDEDAPEAGDSAFVDGIKDHDGKPLSIKRGPGRPRKADK